jgi:SPP1 family predicted phage head-tail adaptor
VLSRRGASEAGRLRLRLVLEYATATPDGAGGSTLEWAEVATVAADVTPVRADERGVGEGLGDLTLQRIVIRRRDDVASGDRFRLDNRVFRIRSITDPEEDGRYLACICEEEGRP